jgi:hypothetical protein
MVESLIEPGLTGGLAKPSGVRTVSEHIAVDQQRSGIAAMVTSAECARCEST